MSRGKYAARAANRKAELEVEANVSELTKKVEELTAENSRMRERLVEKDRAHSAETRRLKQQVRDGASPALEVAEQECAELRKEVIDLRANLAAIRKRWSRSFNRMVDHFFYDHGQGNAEALESCLTIVGPKPEDVTISNLAPAARIDASGVRVVQRARGERK